MLSPSPCPPVCDFRVPATTGEALTSHSLLCTHYFALTHLLDPIFLLQNFHLTTTSSTLFPHFKTIKGFHPTTVCSSHITPQWLSWHSFFHFKTSAWIPLCPMFEFVLKIWNITTVWLVSLKDHQSDPKFKFQTRLVQRTPKIREN